jgi:hypothetical protein
VTPWTQQFALSWPVTLRFFERRFAIAKTLEERRMMRGLRVSESQISLLLGDPNHRLTYSADGLEVAVLQPGAEFERVIAAATLVIESLEPARIVRPTALFQWLAPLAAEYDIARRRFAESVLPAQPGTVFKDMAVLVDGSVAEPEMTFQMEFGIVDRAEVPSRLGRSVGRVDTGERRPPTLWPLESLPEVAFFCDSTWDIDQPVGSSSEQVIALWNSIREAASRVVGNLVDQLGVSHE